MNKDESIRFASRYLEDLLSFFGINVAVTSTIDDEVIQLSVPSTSLNSLLIGRNADNLRALQHIVSMALVSKEAEVTRVNVDVAAIVLRDDQRIGIHGLYPAAERLPEQMVELRRQAQVGGYVQSPAVHTEGRRDPLLGYA